MDGRQISLTLRLADLRLTVEEVAKAVDVKGGGMHLSRGDRSLEDQLIGSMAETTKNRPGSTACS